MPRARANATKQARIRAGCEQLLKKGGPRIVHQPIVELATRKVVGYEAPSRFDDGMSAANRSPKPPPSASAWNSNLPRSPTR